MKSPVPNHRSWLLTILLAVILATAWVVGAFILAFMRPVGDIPRTPPKLANYNNSLSFVVQPLTEDVIAAAMFDYAAEEEDGAVVSITETPAVVDIIVSPSVTASPDPTATPTFILPATATATNSVEFTWTPRPTRTLPPSATNTTVPATNTPVLTASPRTATPEQPRPSATNPPYPPPPTRTTEPRPSATPRPTAYP